MKVKEFEGLSLRECLQQVRQELGPEAVILETRKCRTRGLLGLGARDAIRIVAATGITVNEPHSRAGQSGGKSSLADTPTGPEADSPATAPIPPQRAARTAYGNTEPPARLDPAMVMHGQTADAPAEEKLARLEKEIRELRSGFDVVRQTLLAAPPPQQILTSPPAAAAPAPSRPFPELYARLRDADVSERLATEFIESLPDLSAWNPQARIPLAETALRQLMAERVECSGPITLTAGQRKVVALIGPTGVGKTTTIAKLAAHFALVEKRRVGLLSLDTYRIAAVEQLKTYGQIINIPVQVAYDQSDVLPAMETYKDYDLVLIDTAGRSQKNVMQMSELKSLLEATGCETHLVLSASTRERDLYDQVERFSRARVDRLLFSKLDETTSYGTIYSLAASTRLPVSYLTTGQRVPEDIEIADSAKLAAFVLNSPARAA